MRMRTTFENGVLRNGQQSVSAVNNFIDQGEFGAMKTLSDRIAPRCDKPGPEPAILDWYGHAV